MKKSIVFMLAILVATFSLSAQEVLISEGFDTFGLPAGWNLYDADGDGHNWENNNNPGYESDKSFSSASWKHGGIGALTPDNWLDTPSFELSEEGGTLTYWVGAQDADYPAEHYAVYASVSGDFTSEERIFEETLTAKSSGRGGKTVPITGLAARNPERARVQSTWFKRELPLNADVTIVSFRHFNSTDQFWINLDEVKITKKTPAIGDITLPYSQDFESGELPAGWNLFDGDEDGHNWEHNPIFAGHESEKCFSSASWKHDGIGALTPNNWLDSPKFVLPAEGGKLTYWVSAQDADYAAEHYAVYASVNGNFGVDEKIFEETLTAKSNGRAKTVSIASQAARGVERGRVQGTWFKRVLQLNADVTIISFRHYNTTDQFWINVDDVKIEEKTNLTITLPYSQDFEAAELPPGWNLFDGDEDGHNWECNPNFAGHESEFCFSSASWKHNGIGALTPSNWLDTPVFELPAEGGKLTYWVCAQDENYAAEHYAVYASVNGNFGDNEIIFEETLTAKGAVSKGEGIIYANSKPERTENGRDQGTWYKRVLALPANTTIVSFRHFKTTDQFWINLDDVKIEVASEEPIDDQVSLPYFEQFSDGVIPSNWRNLDQDGDGYKWVTTYSESNPINVAMSASWIGGNTLFPDNWLITPLMPGVRSVVYDVTATNMSDYFEHYSILASSTTNEPAAFSTVFSETLTAAEAATDILEGIENFKPRGINVPVGTKYIAFRHHDCSDQFWLILDNMLFSKDEVTLMNGVEADNINLYVLDGKLIVNTSKNGLAIEVYSMDGRLAARSKSLVGRTEIELASGSYVVKVGGFTGKVSIK